MRLAFTLLARMSAWLPHRPCMHHSCPAFLQGVRLHSTPRRRTVPCAAVRSPDAAPRKNNMTNYKMTELREMLRIRGLSPNGKKVDLVKRLRAHLAERGAPQSCRYFVVLHAALSACFTTHLCTRLGCPQQTLLWQVTCTVQVLRWGPTICRRRRRRLHQVLLRALPATRSGMCRLRGQLALWRSWRQQLRHRGQRLVRGQDRPVRLLHGALSLSELRLRQAGVLRCRGARVALLRARPA